jgi:hypothetical protein
MLTLSLWLSAQLQAAQYGIPEHFQWHHEEMNGDK